METVCVSFNEICKSENYCWDRYMYTANLPATNGLTFFFSSGQNCKDAFECYVIARLILCMTYNHLIMLINMRDA